MVECLFCKLANGNQKIYENDYFYSTFDTNPVSPGYSLVISKRHVLKLLDLTDTEWIALKDAIKYTEENIKSTDLKSMYEEIIKNSNNERSKKLCQSMIYDINITKHPDAYNVGVNDGEAAGRTIHHLHIHIIPRFIGDSPHSSGGIRYILRHKDIGFEK